MPNRAQRRRDEKAGAKRPVAPPVGPVSSQAGPGDPQGTPGITVNASDLLQKIGAQTVEIDFWKNKVVGLEQQLNQVLEITSTQPQESEQTEEEQQLKTIDSEEVPHPEEPYIPKEELEHAPPTVEQAQELELLREQKLEE